MQSDNTPIQQPVRLAYERPIADDSLFTRENIQYLRDATESRLSHQKVGSVGGTYLCLVVSAVMEIQRSLDPVMICSMAGLLVLATWYQWCKHRRLGTPYYAVLILFEPLLFGGLICARFAADSFSEPSSVVACVVTLTVFTGLFAWNWFLHRQSWKGLIFNRADAPFHRRLAALATTMLGPSTQPASADVVSFHAGRGTQWARIKIEGDLVVFSGDKRARLQFALPEHVRIIGRVPSANGLAVSATLLWNEEPVSIVIDPQKLALLDSQLIAVMRDVLATESAGQSG